MDEKRFPTNISFSHCENREDEPALWLLPQSREILPILHGCLRCMMRLCSGTEITMNRRQFLATAGAASLARVNAARSRPPNIVWIMGDDLGYGDLGCYGQKYIRTPNIDRLAASGMQFSDAYAGCTVCAPSRSVLMTGLHSGHTCVRSNPGGEPLLASHSTQEQLLQSPGYV